MGPTIGKESSSVFHPSWLFHSDTGTISQVLYLLKSMAGHPRKLLMGRVEAGRGAKTLIGPGMSGTWNASRSVNPNSLRHCSVQ